MPAFGGVASTWTHENVVVCEFGHGRVERRVDSVVHFNIQIHLWARAVWGDGWKSFCWKEGEKSR